jgi:hypothetical protein
MARKFKEDVDGDGSAIATAVVFFLLGFVLALAIGPILPEMF